MTAKIESLTVEGAGAIVLFLGTLEDPLPSNVVSIESARKGVAPKPGATFHPIIKDRDSKKAGRTIAGDVLEGAQAEVLPNASIRLFGTYANHKDGPTPYDITFRVGDRAVYDSFNFDYTCTITKIAAGTVTIAEDVSDRPHQLNLYQLTRRNWDYEAGRIAKRQEEWRD